MMRIHIRGGGANDWSNAAALYQADPAAIAALLATLGVTHYRPIGGGDIHVGADVLQQPDGSTANVEFLPIAPVAGIEIAAGEYHSFDLKPTRKFQPTALILDDDVAKNLAMTNLAIGGQPVPCGSGALLGRGFSQGAFNNALSSMTSDNSTPITFELHNIHATVAQVVRGHFIGNSVANR